MKKWNIYIIALLMLGACTNETLVDDPTDKTGGSNLTLTLKFPQSADMTKALTPADENRINKLDILVFKKKNSGSSFLDDEFAYSIQVSGTAINGSGDTRTANVFIEKMQAHQRFILLANLPANSLNGTTDTVVGNSLGNIVKKLTFSAAAWQKDDLTSTDPAFPMWGQMANANAANPNYEQFYEDKGPSGITINMIRAVARIDVGVDINGTGDPALGGGSIFTIDSVFLCNTRTSGTINPQDNYLLSADSVSKTEIRIPNLVNGDLTTRVGYKFVQPTGETTMVRTIYTTESEASPANKLAFLVIHAKYNGEYYYYRVDFANNGSYVPLLRNHNYTINILGIRAAGYSSLAEAEASNPSPSNPSLVFDITDTDLNEVITNEQYYLAYEANEIKIDWDKPVSFKAKTDFPGGVKVSTANYFVSGAPGDIQTISRTLSENTDGTPDYYTITLSAGMLKKDIKVMQSAGSNSYVVASGKSMRIPLSSANPAREDDRIGNTTKVQVLWTEGVSISNGNNIPFSNGIITISGISGSGNAVIAAKDINDNILYSWHLWVTDYNPENASGQKHNNGFTFMDRNLGAANNTTNDASYGLYYQWGRKEPFSMASSPAFGIDTIVPGMTLDVAIQHPDIFYAAINPPFDWAGSVQNNNLWNTSAKGKSAYDPCPFGWRVPAAENDNTGSPWSGFSGNSQHGSVYPPAGYLDAFSGKRTGATMANQTYVWGGSARSQGAFVHNFITGATNAFRANAYPVRCVKDTK